MVTLSQYSGVTFRRPYYQSAPGEGAASTTSPEWTTERTTEWSSEWTTRYYTTTPPPPTRGVTVCLRFLTDLNGLDLFKLSPRSPLTVSWRNPSTYTLSWNYYSSVTLRVMISLWSSVRTQPWTSVCVVLDSFKNIVQVFQGGSMSIRKIPPSRLVWSGEPVVDVSGLDGQVTDLEVWDYPLGYAEVFSYMQNYGSGTVLTWSNIAYSNRGRILIEESYALRQMKPLNHSERQEQPIRRGRGRSLRLKYRKMWKGKKQRNQMV
ncbi:hypothetical protein NL108_014302 [Boleophthalmus pectinirostris]|nr:hypothetical protein NL108_014302 [Boleophthalmus pectinirostris]